MAKPHGVLPQVMLTRVAGMFLVKLVNRFVAGSDAFMFHYQLRTSALAPISVPELTFYLLVQGIATH